MKIKVPQGDLICNLRFVKSCDYVYSFTDWLHEGKTCQVCFNPKFLDQLRASDKEVVTVYYKFDYKTLKDFFDSCARVPGKKIVLVTGCSDYSVTKDLFDLRPDNIIKWYGENISHRHKDLIPLPMGSLSATWIGDSDEGAQIRNHKDYKLVKVDGKEPRIMNIAFMCFSMGTNPNHRKGVYSHFSSKRWVTDLCSHKTGKYLNDDEFMNMVFNHHFVISPFGNGIDCGRTWMTLQLGCIPIMPYHLCFEEWAKHLPIVLYRDINEITPQYLLGRLEQFKARDFSYEYLKTSYWKDRWEKDKAEISASAGS
jgi:hypothetical protein